MYIFNLATPHIGCYFPDQGSNPYPLHWKFRVLTTRPSAKSLSLLFDIYNHLLWTRTFVRCREYKMNKIHPVTPT